jgi:hypothetical protein
MSMTGTVVVAIQKIDNGYVINLVEAPKRPEKRTGPRNPAVTIDDMIDGIIDFNKNMEAETTGENWKGDDEERRVKLREAFKKMNPGLIARMAEGPPPEPRVEHKCFAFKVDLLKYLEENL